MCFVHNLSYDIEFLLPFLRKKFGQEKSTIIIDSHKVLSIRFDKIEFRCSYLLTGKSLDTLSNEYQIEHKKLTGSLDYNKIRYQDDKLSQTTLDYFTNDIVGLHEILTILIKKEHGINNLPLTVTGYVRKYCRKQSQKERTNRRNFIRTKLTYDMYKIVNKTYKGGYTHTNCDYRGELVKGNILHYDFESHYPTVMLLEKFPIGKFHENKITSRKQLDKFNKTHCQIIHIKVYACKLKRNRYFSYIALSDINAKAMNDNGRVYESYDTFELYVTYEDLQIIEQQYDISYDIVTTYCAVKGYLPKYMRESILHFFSEKNRLKDEIHNCTDTSKLFDLKLDYQRSKGMLNGIYGMTATNPVRSEFKILEDGTFMKMDNNSQSEKEKLEKFYKTRNSFLPYQWGTWVTAYARKYLFDVFDVIGEKNVLYCDTDSAFFIAEKDVTKRIQKYNDNIRQKAIDTNSYILVNDKKKYIGGFYDEEEKISEFKALHSKCYMYSDEKGLHTTIAGVVKAYKDKNNKVHYNTEELTNFDDFDDGFKFSEKFGGTTSKHVYGDIRTENINGHKTMLASGIIICNTTKEIHNNYDELR